MRKALALSFIFAFGLALVSPAFADCGGDECSMKSGMMKGGMKGMMKGGQMPECPVTAKFLMKTDFLLDHKTDLALTDEQVATIKGLELEVKKTGVRQSADMQVMMLDVMAKLHEDKIDVEGTNALIDKGSASMAESVKSVVAAFAKLKETLTADQMAKMKDIHDKEEASEHSEHSH